MRCAGVPIIGPIYSDLISGHNSSSMSPSPMVPITWWVLYRTRFGLRLRAVGENPAAVDTAGISVTLAALPGGDHLRRAVRRRRRLSCRSRRSAGFVKDMTAGSGFIALAALIFAKWRPVPVLFACLLFGFLDAVAIRLQGVPLPRHRRGAGAAHAGDCPIS